MSEQAGARSCQHGGVRGIPDTVLVAPDAFGDTLSSYDVASALAAGLAAGGWKVDLCPLVAGGAGVLQAVDFDRRMRAARAVVTGDARLDLGSLRGRAISEVATRARQAGVPCHAVVAHRELDAFGLRILDLQAVLQASTTSEIKAAGIRLAAVL